MRALLALALLLVACGAPVRAASSASRPVATSSPAPAGGNRELAEREAERLLSRARVPDGARAVAAASVPIPAGVLGTPGADSLVDRSRAWRLAMSVDAALTWFRANPPAGLTFFGSGHGYDGKAHYDGYEYQAPATPAWDLSQLQITLTADGDGTAVRADGIVVWLDPRPLPDSAAGPRLRVTAAGGCPPTDETFVGVTNPDAADLHAQLLPVADPADGLVCQFGGDHPLDADRFHLRRATTLGHERAADLAAAVRLLPLGHVVGGTMFCPVGLSSSAVIVFTYAGRDDVDLWLDPGGCSFVASGFVRAGGGTLVQAVEDATR